MMVMVDALEASTSALHLIVAVPFFHIMVLAVLFAQIFGCVPKKVRKQRTAHYTVKSNHQDGGLRRPTTPSSSPSPSPSPARSPMPEDEDDVAKSPEESASTRSSRHEGETPPESQFSVIKPRNFRRDAKQARIAMGEVRDKSEYPTMADVLSDWDSVVQKNPDEEGGGESTNYLATENLPTSPVAPGASKKAEIDPAKTSIPIEKKAAAKGAESSQHEESKEELLSVDPPKASFKEAGSTVVFKLKSVSTDRLVYKARCTNNKLYRMGPVHGFIEPKGTASLEVERAPGPPKKDRLEVCYRTAAANATNAKELFKADKTVTGVISVPLTVGPTTVSQE